MRVFLIFVTAVSAATDKCCKEKKVGEILYTLAESDMDDETAKFGCKAGCVYKADEDPVDRFCFKDGSLPVTCLDGGDHEFHWCYEGDCGAEFWGDHFPACNGESQSPIDIVTGPAPVPPPAPLNFGNYDKIRMEQLSLTNQVENYGGIVDGKGTRLEDGTFKNNGHTAQLDVIATLPGDVGVLSGGHLEGDYQILQLHFHWGADDTKGSEHTLDGKMFPLELHIVHKKVGEPDFLSVPGGLAVTGFFFEISADDNAAIEPLVAALENVMNPDDKFDMAGSAFTIPALIADVKDTGFSTYDGSLTTPGCMEVVNWINFIQPLKISSAQLAKFRTLKDSSDADIVDNFRPVQPLNDRTVVFYSGV